MSIRREFQDKKRILVKAGTGVLTDNRGCVSLGRFGHLVEQIAELKAQGKEVMLVSSGAVAMGRQKLQESIAPPSLKSSACAAAGQSGLMALYDSLFRQKDIWCSQILLTDEDFLNAERRANLRDTINELIRLGAVPILNENDVISSRKNAKGEDRLFRDNDSLASLVAAETNVDLVVLLSDVDGLYTEPPKKGKRGGNVIDTYTSDVKFTIGAGSSAGRGGMQAKIEAALHAISHGVFAVVVASGHEPNVITAIVSGAHIGTLFVQHPERELASARQLAIRSRKAEISLVAMDPKKRQELLIAIADNLEAAKDKIFEANQKDIALGKEKNLRPSLAARLVLDEKKLKTLVAGVKQIAAVEDPIGKVLKRRELADGLILEEVKVPIGVLLVIFEARPDVLPQVAALAIRSGNGLILKGGSEAINTNTLLHSIITTTISRAGLDSHLVGLVQSHEQIEELLRLKEIDLVIPRGSAELVSHIQQNTRIPVLGHSEGVCHVFVDDDVDLDMAARLVVDSKTDYPAACNAAETLLLHRNLVIDGRAKAILDALKSQNVQLYTGSCAAEHFPDLPATASLHTEYSDLGMTVEIVESVDEAISHINEYGSGHTDAILTNSNKNAQAFCQLVDSACVFHNASTRFADGYRFGLGAEVGISTSRIHARGPVGIEGLLSSKWVLVSKDGGSVVSDFTSGKRSYMHKELYPPHLEQPPSIFSDKVATSKLRKQESVPNGHPNA